MKFENVKVGDTVFTEKQVSYGWNSGERFYIPEKVVRVTKTQFAVESGDRYKKEGNKIGDSWTKAYFEGDNTGYYSKKIVKDETENMKAFKLKLEAEEEFNYIAERIKVSRNSDFSVTELQDMVQKLKDIQSVIKTKQSVKT